MQMDRKSNTGLRTFLRNDGLIITDKKGKPRVAIGVISEDKNALRSGTPSTFNKLGSAS